MKDRLFALAFLSCAIVGAARADADSAQDMVGLLSAAAPDTSLGDQAALFSRLAGTWQGDYVFFGKDGAATRFPGVFSAGWVMEGRALQCLYTLDRSAEHKEKYIGTSLNYFEPKSKSWRMVFVDPEADSTLQVTGGPVSSDRIELLSAENDGKVTRWSFSDIRADSFTYRDETTRDGGRSWRLNEEDHMTRQTFGGRS